MQARVVLYLLPLVAALSIGAAEAQRIQWGNYLVTEELLLFPEVNVGAALCSLESNFSSPGLRLGIGGAWTVSENLFDADGTSVSSQKLESTPGFDDVIAPLTDLNGDGRLEIGFSGDVEFLRQRVYIGSHTSEGFINTTNLLTLDPSQPPLSRFFVLQQRYNTSNYAFGLSVTYIGDVDNNGVGDIAISGGHTSSYTATAFHILFLDKNLEVLNVTTTTLFPDESVAAFAINSELGIDFTSFASSIAGIGDVDGDNIPDMAATAETDEGTLLFILFLTPEGNVKKYRIHSTESVYNPPGTNRPRELWNWGIIKSMGVEAALTEAERFSSADYNNDQHPDLILASLQMGDTWMLFLDDKGNITGNMYYGAGIQREGSGVAVVDANDDSVPDVVLSKDFPVDQGTIKVLLMDAIRITVTSASFSEEEEEEEEGEDSQTRTLLATFQVELSARPRFAIQVDFQVETSDNISDEDVVLLSPSPLNFGIGQTSTVVQVSVVLPVEESEGMKSRKQQEPTITLHLANTMNALVNSSGSSFSLSLINSEDSSNTEPNKEDSNDQTTIIAPVVSVGVVLLIAVIVGVGFGVWWRRRKTRIEKEMKVDSQYGAIEGGMHSERHEESEEQMESGDIWNIAYTELTFVEKIGEGAFGEVWKGMWRNSEVAIKKLHSIEEEQLQDFQTEAQTLKGLRPHGNVIRLLGVVNKPLCIVTEFMDRGDLNTYLLHHKDDIDADTMLKWAIDIASGMRHLHSEGITHRDLATRNLLLTKALRLKVADFGMSRKLETKGGAQKTTNEVGPLKWMAPEAIEDHLYSEKSDVWSFGVCLWEIASFGAIPFEGLTAVNAAMRVCQQREVLEPPENVPPVLREVMLSCWAFSPEERPTFADILKALKEEATLP